MASKKNKKPDQEIYRPPKSDRSNYEASDKSHERTFYNSNHKKKLIKSDNEEKIIKPESQIKSSFRDVKSNPHYYEGDFSGDYYQEDYRYYQYDNYPSRYPKYKNEYEYENYSDKHRFNSSHYVDDNYYQSYDSRYYKTMDYNSYKSQSKYNNTNKPNQFNSYDKQRQQKQSANNYQKKPEKLQSKVKKDMKKPEKCEDKKQNVNYNEYNEYNAVRSRQNSYNNNKDFTTDNRLFNPYKITTESVAVVTDTISGTGGSKSGRSGNCNTDGKEQKPVSTAASEPFTPVVDNDCHIHGGLIHLPDNLEIRKSGAVSLINSPTVTSSDNVVNSKTSDNKPTVMVRPTFSHVSSNSTSYPTVPIIHGIQTISGFIPVQSNFITPGTINLMRAPPSSLPTPHIMSPIRFTSHQIVHTPDDPALYTLSNIVSKSSAVVQCINQIKSLEMQLDVLIRSSCDISSPDWWQSVNSIRLELMDLYRSVITSDLDYCNQAGIEQNLWKSVFYSIMELIRTFINNPDSINLPQNHKDQINKIKINVTSYGQNILQSGEEYFISIFTDISKLHNIDLEAIFLSRRPPPETGSRTRKLVYLSAQKLLLFLGDLARYSEMINNTSDFTKARIWYLKAQLLVPKNGRPYNQLAVISIYANRHLDALYYYTRTLAASNPFPTASQSLSFLFEETRKTDEMMRRQQESIKRKKKKQNTTTENRKKGCIEIWIHPDDGTKEKKVTDDDDADILATFDTNDDPKQKVDRQIKEDYISMPLIELHKLFTLSFLNSHGKLFGKINMENFPEVCSTMLQEFWAILSHQPCPLSSYRLCNILIINMYIMDRVSQQTSVVNNYALRSLHQDHASRMTLDFFALICQRAIEIFDEWIETEDISNNGPLQLPTDLSLLLPPLCLWTDWMVTHPEYWNPPPSHRDPLLLPSIDDFGLISKLCTKVNRLVERGAPALSRPHYRVLSDSKDADKAISNKKTFVLLEENLISGFLPMLDQIPKIYLLEDDKWTKEQTDDWIHMEKLSLFGDFLCGINPPLLDYNVDTCTYVPTVIKEGSERLQDGIDAKEKSEVVIEDPADSDEDLDIKLKKEIDEINSTHGTNTETSNEQTSWADLTEQAEEEEREHQRRIAQLKIKRANLKFKEEKNRRFELWRKSLLDHEIAQRFVELEIRPLFLVLDTNCYIDYLSNIKLLIDHKKFIIIVPLIVVNELENLSKTYQLKDDVDIHARAKEALKFLEEKFDKADQYVRAITSRGTFMETIAYRAEAVSWSEGETNDDVILNCCQHLCKDKPIDFMPREKDKPITLHRDVVLLTGDRNLRLKALSRHIPVKPLKRFMEWADIRRNLHKK